MFRDEMYPLFFDRLGGRYVAFRRNIQTSLMVLRSICIIFVAVF